ncbi:MAG: hypothetical protein WD066_02015 [Planctomycetaceae bacterium]
MSLPAFIRLADRDRRFADLGEPVSFRTIEREYDPLAQQTNETADDAAITAIIGPAPQRATRGAAGHHATGTLVVLVKAEVLPAAPGPGQRIIRGDDEYDILTAARSADGLVWEITCRLRE